MATFHCDACGYTEQVQGEPVFEKEKCPKCGRVVQAAPSDVAVLDALTAPTGYDTLPGWVPRGGAKPQEQAGLGGLAARPAGRQANAGGLRGATAPQSAQSPSNAAAPRGSRIARTLLFVIGTACVGLVCLEVGARYSATHSASPDSKLKSHEAIAIGGQPSADEAGPNSPAVATTSDKEAKTRNPTIAQSETIAAVQPAPSPSPVEQRVAASIEAIRAASDPSAAVAAFANGSAADPNNVQLNEAYVNRMVDLGLAGATYQQARLAVGLDPSYGLGWAVMAYVDFRRGEPEAAILDVTLAIQNSPQDRFCQTVAGMLLAWYDKNRDQLDLPDPLRQSLAKAHLAMDGQAAYVTAYDKAKATYDVAPPPAVAQASPATRPAEAQAVAPLNVLPMITFSDTYNYVWNYYDYTEPGSGPIFVGRYGYPGHRVEPIHRGGDKDPNKDKGKGTDVGKSRGFADEGPRAAAPPRLEERPLPTLQLPTLVLQERIRPPEPTRPAPPPVSRGEDPRGVTHTATPVAAPTSGDLPILPPPAQFPGQRPAGGH